MLKIDLDKILVNMCWDNYKYKENERVEEILNYGSDDFHEFVIRVLVNKTYDQFDDLRMQILLSLLDLAEVEYINIRNELSSKLNIKIEKEEADANKAE